MAVIRVGLLSALLVFLCLRIGYAVELLPLLPAAEISNGASIYAVNDYGGSIAWIKPPIRSNPAFDLLSGDDAAHLQFQINGGTVSVWLPTQLAGNCFLSYCYPTKSPSVVDIPAHTLSGGTEAARSEIHIPLGAAGGAIIIDITTHLDSDGDIHQAYDILNNAGTSISGIQFTEYLTFHPNGSATGFDAAQGTTSFAQMNGVGGLLVTGNQALASYLSDVFVFGLTSATAGAPSVPVDPTAHDIGHPSTDVIGRIEAGLFNGANSPCKGAPLPPSSVTEADLCSGALMWDLPALDEFHEVHFEIHKDLLRVPEPGTLWLLLSAFGASFLRMLLRRRAGRRTASISLAQGA